VIRCTYRLQLGGGWGFAEARSLVPYLRDLGVSHLYLSPIWEARAGSAHGYDVVDPTHVSEALGGEEGLKALAAAGLPLVVDVVPNHMAVSEAENPFWRDPLWRAKFFDLDWRTGAHRRFFDVGELAGVRQEDPEVFETTHRKAVELVRAGVIDGLRIDHVDGLANPARYLERLREAGAEHVWVEKILASGERLRDWPVEGTVGYEFLNEATALFVDPAGEPVLTELYATVAGERRPFAEVAADAKLDQTRTTFAEEVERLQSLLPAEPGFELERALAALPVYRTYVQPELGRVEPADRRVVADAGLEPGLAAILLLEERGHDAFVTRFQQTTPAVAAKGVEDTAFYRWNRLLALNEVGGDPARFALSVSDFHWANLERAARHGRGLLATTTHDTKRSADVRARLVALSAPAAGWPALVEHAWEQVSPSIDPNDAYLVLQTLVGAWPLAPPRRDAYLEKALRESKRRTSWLEPDRDYEEAARAYAAALVSSGLLEPFVERLQPLAERASLGMTLLKLTSPGVPDLYQGDEVPLLALVDPDNRRPVDWEARRRALADPAPGSKLDLIRRTLALRRRCPEAFAGDYEPLEASDDVCAFSRGRAVMVAVALRGDLADWRPPAGDWRDVLPASPYLRLLERGA
jgi:(1->4)-alpha-D-glucan 1-alpha-D-glucosylmutase